MAFRTRITAIEHHNGRVTPQDVKSCRSGGSRSKAGGVERKTFALQLVANTYIETKAHDVAEELQKLGGAAPVVVTAPNLEVLSPLLDGLAAPGKLLVHTAIGPVPSNTFPMINNALWLAKWTCFDSKSAIAFAQNQGVECLIDGFRYRS